MNTRATVVVVLLSTMLTATAWSEVWKVNPGTGLGPISLGQEYLQANKVLTPKDAMVTKVGAYLRYKEGIELECQDKKITQIIIHQSSFQGKTGTVDVAVEGNIKIGSSAAQMETALGRNYESHALPVAKKEPPQTYYAYRSRGMGLITRGGAVIEISIWPRK